MKHVKDIQTIEKKQLIIETFDFINIVEKSVNYIGAKAGNCKTLLMVNIWNKISRIKLNNIYNFNSLFLSMEMNENDIMIRMKGIFNNDETFKEWATNSINIIDDSKNLKIEEVYQKVKDFKKNNQLHFLFIDYAQLIDGNQEEISKSLVKLADSENIIIFACLQFSPEFNIKYLEENTGTNFISGSTRYAKDATTITCCCKGSEKNTLHIGVAKNRYAKNFQEKTYKYKILETGEISGSTNLNIPDTFDEKYLRKIEFIQIAYANNYLVSKVNWKNFEEENGIKKLNLIEFDTQNLYNKIELYSTVILMNKICKYEIPRYTDLIKTKIIEIIDEIFERETGQEIKDLTNDEYKKDLGKFRKDKIKVALSNINDFVIKNIKVAEDFSNAYGKIIIAKTFDNVTKTFNESNEIVNFDNEKAIQEFKREITYTISKE